MTSLRRHVLIAGTGRAGTSFLVQYLHALGLETMLKYGPLEGQWSEEANAGLEVDIRSSERSPYVVKSPWLSEYIDEVIDSPELQIDAVILPIRNIVEAATSRSINEVRRLQRTNMGLKGNGETWNHYGATPGGVVYSLQPIDQARILALEFHSLVEKLVRAGIPIIFLSFPRLVEDAAYLFEGLAPILPPTTDRQRALEEHGKVASPDKVRVESEIVAPLKRSGVSPFPDLQVINAAALNREIKSLRQKLQHRDEALAAAHIRLDVEAERADREGASRLQELSVASETIAALRAQLDAESEHARVAEAQNAEDAARAAALSTALAEQGGRAILQEGRAADLAAQLRQIFASKSWRVTAPLRRISALLPSSVRSIR